MKLLKNLLFNKSINNNQNSLNKFLHKNMIVSAKVLKTNKNFSTLNIRGKEILAKGLGNLKEGSTINLKIIDLKGDNEIKAKIIKTIISNDKMDIHNSYSALNKNILKVSSENRIFLSVEELKEIENNFTKHSDNFNDLELIKSFMIMNKLDSKDEGLIYELYKFLNDENIYNLEDNKFDIKELIDYLKREENKENGNNILNQYNKLDGIYEFKFYHSFFNDPIYIKIKNNNRNKTSKDESYTLSIKINLKKLGPLVIKIFVWNKEVELDFSFEKTKTKSELNGLNDLKGRIEGHGFNIKQIKVTKLID